MLTPDAKVLVTGGAGFIGSHLVERLLAEGNAVRVLDNFSTGRAENLDQVRDAVGPAAAARLEVHTGDLREPADVARAVKGMNVVFHEAALGSVERSVEDPLTTNEVNTTGTLRLLVAARDAGVARLVFAGSSSVYGEVEGLPKTEEMATIPMSPYGTTKRDGELYCRQFAMLYGFNSVTVRYFNVFGPRQSPNSQYAAVIPIFIDRILKGEPPIINGDGEQSRDFTYVANVVDANLLAARAPAEAVRGEILNMACGTRYSLNELVRLLAGLTGKEVAPHYRAARAGDVRHSEADISRARRILGYQPRVSFEDGLRQTVEYFQKSVVPLP
jgi:nucleoside-diphosphate-sugar epimerase